MKNTIILHNKNIIAYICLVNFYMNVKTKINCKTESYVFIMFSMVGRIWMREGPHATRGPGVENHWFKRSLLSLNLISFFSTPSVLSKIGQ